MSYEYHSEDLPGTAQNEMDRLNQLASEGWELIAVERSRGRFRRDKSPLSNVLSKAAANPESDLPAGETFTRPGQEVALRAGGKRGK